MVHESTLLLVLDLAGTFVFALNGALTADRAHVYSLPAALGAVAVCFAIRMLAVRYHVTAPVPRRGPPADPAGSESSSAAS
jgi:uncharacterized membrane protein YeiH